MRFSLTASLAGSLLPWVAWGATATIVGTVKFTGTAPKKEVLKMTSDPFCARANQGKTIYQDGIAVNANGTLGNVFVALKEGVPNDQIPPVPTTAVEFAQTGCQYLPHVIGLRVGQTLRIHNNDGTLHNVRGIATANKSFNDGMALKDQVLEKKFTKAEQMLRIKCDVHGWMNAYIGVMDHPYFAVTDGSGSFRIADVPLGDYTVEAWQETLGVKTQKVKVLSGGAVKTVDFVF